MEPGSEAARLVKQMLTLLQTEPEGDLLGVVQSRLTEIAMAWEHVDGHNVGYYYPDIVAAFERREAADVIVCGVSPVSNTLQWLKYHYAQERLPDSQYTMVTRLLP